MAPEQYERIFRRKGSSQKGEGQGIRKNHEFRRRLYKQPGAQFLTFLCGTLQSLRSGCEGLSKLAQRCTAIKKLDGLYAENQIRLSLSPHFTGNFRGRAAVGLDALRPIMDIMLTSKICDNVSWNFSWEIMMLVGKALKNSVSTVTAPYHKKECLSQILTITNVDLSIALVNLFIRPLSSSR